MADKKGKGRKARSPKLTRLEKLTKGLSTDPKDVKAMFTIKEVEGKGRGVFLRAPILPKDSFVLEYEGDVISESEAQSREKIYAHNNEGCFIMSFKFMGTKWAIDATRRFDSFTRLLNHSKRPNIRFHSPILIDLNGKGLPRIAAYAIRDIHKGEEIVFDYGVRDKSITWLRNREIGFASDVDSDSSSTEDDDNSSSNPHGDCEMSFKISPVKPVCSSYDAHGSSESESASSGQHIDGSLHLGMTLYNSARNRARRGKRSFCEGEWGLRFTCLIPGNKEKSYIAGYESIGTPQKIMKMVEDFSARKKQRFDNDSVICLSSSSDDSLKGSASSSNLQNRNAYNGYHSEVLASASNSYVELPRNKEPNSINKVLEWEIPPAEDSTLNIKIIGVQSLSDPPHTETITHRPHVTPHFIPTRQQNSVPVQPQGVPLGPKVDVNQTSNFQRQQPARSDQFPETLPTMPVLSRTSKDEVVSVDPSDHESESSSLPSLSPLPNSTAVDTSSGVGKKVYIISDDECEPGPSQEKNPKRSITKCALNTHSIESESSESECEIICPDSDKPGSSKQTNKLSSLRAARPVGFCPQVAVIKPFSENSQQNRDVEQSSGDLDLPGDNQGNMQTEIDARERMTESEFQHLKRIFTSCIFANKTSRMQIQTKIYENWNFFKVLTDRGISVDQIRATVRTFFKSRS